MMVLLRWTWVLEPVCLPYHPLDPQPPWLSCRGSQEPPVLGAGRLHGSLLPVLPSTASLLSPCHCTAGTDRQEPRTYVWEVALPGDALKMRWVTMAWRPFAGLRESVSVGDVLPGWARSGP